MFWTTRYFSERAAEVVIGDGSVASMGGGLNGLGGAGTVLRP